MQPLPGTSSSALHARVYGRSFNCYVCVLRFCCAYDIRVCSTVGDAEYAQGDKVWMARLWRQVSQLSLRSLTSSSMFSFGLKDDILTSVPLGLGSWMDFIKGPVESVDQLNEDQLTPACYYSWAQAGG